MHDLVSPANSIRSPPWDGIGFDEIGPSVPSSDRAIHVEVCFRGPSCFSISVDGDGLLNCSIWKEMGANPKTP